MTSIAKNVISLDELGFTAEGARKTFAAGVLAFLAVALSTIYVTAPAWYLLGVGQSVLPERLYPLTAMVILFITTGGLTSAFVGATIGLLALWQALGKEVSFTAVRVFAGLSYLWGLGDKLRTSRIAQAAFVVVVLLTYFSVSLTLGFHSTLARINVG